LRLPLAFSERLDVFDLRIQAPGLKAEAVKAVRGLGGARWENRAGGATLEMRRRDYRPEDRVEASFSAAGGPLVTVEEFDGKRYFYAELPAPAHAPRPRPSPRQLALVWDASGSGAKREHGREFALLDAYFRALGNTRVRLTLARDAQRRQRHFRHQGRRLVVLAGSAGEGQL
jgi:Ca-activated chloride channel family protein